MDVKCFQPPFSALRSFVAWRQRVGVKYEPEEIISLCKCVLEKHVKTICILNESSNNYL